MTKRFNSVGMVAFTIEHSCYWYHDIPRSQVRAALMRRIADLDEAEEWGEAVAFDDTITNDSPQPALKVTTNGDDTYYQGFARTTCVRHCQEPVTVPTLFDQKVRDFWKVGIGVETQTESFFDFFAEFRREADAHRFARQQAQRDTKE